MSGVPEFRPEYGSSRPDEYLALIQQRWTIVPELRPDVETPQHIFFIGDGDVRWANKNGLPSIFGHWCGAEAGRRVLRAFRQWNIPTVSFWAFSTENWKRSDEEVMGAMEVMDTYFRTSGIIQEFILEEVRMVHIGRKERVKNYYPPLMETVEQIEEATKDNNRFNLLLGLDYGGRDEIVRAVQKIGRKILEGAISPEEINEEVILSYLDTAGFADPDLILRTSGESRISGAVLFQGAYAEFYSEPALLPDLTPQLLEQAIVSFSGRQRRLGGRPST
jgi:undecaprenyl diphosphate synthase